MKWRKWFPWMGLVLVVIVVATYAFYQYWMGPNPAELDREQLTEEEYTRALELIDTIKEEDPFGRRQNVTRRINPQETTGLDFDDPKKIEQRESRRSNASDDPSKNIGDRKSGCNPDDA
ncbi:MULTISPECIES: hypothetical protein [unclassified Exiguobacterium]|uniref:hypothetical protein n=1 Tax=unclassified Exiguobacterium TaxID=2644629 RepID=UPI001BE7CD67|nr:MULTISPECIES: hypothetical protein [unclassified Exiguobacterium]